MRYDDDNAKKCRRDDNMGYDDHDAKKRCDGKSRYVAVVTVSYNIATNNVTDFDVFPNTPFEATECDIAVGDELADVVACLIADGFELVSNVAATSVIGGIGTALGHYTFIRR